MERTFARCIVDILIAWRNCIDRSNSLWEGRHHDRLMEFQDWLPSGSGFDSGTKIDFEKSGRDKIVMYTSFHHMNEHGYYDGWTEHTVICTPSFDGIDLRITGRNRNEIKDYIHEQFYWLLMERLGRDYSFPIERQAAMVNVAELHSMY